MSGERMRQLSSKLMLGAFVVALLLRLAFGLGYWVDKPLTHDEQEYLMLAQNLSPTTSRST